MIFIGDLEPYRKEISGKRKKQYQRLLEQADRYKTMVLPEEHPKESTTYMGIAIPNLALAYCLSGDEEYLHQAKRFIRTVLLPTPPLPLETAMMLRTESKTLTPL